MFGEALVHLDYVLGHVLHNWLQVGLVIRAVVMLRGSLHTGESGTGSYTHHQHTKLDMPSGHSTAQTQGTMLVFLR